MSWVHKYYPDLYTNGQWLTKIRKAKVAHSAKVADEKHGIAPRAGDTLRKRKEIEVPTVEEIQAAGNEKAKKFAREEAEKDGCRDTPATGGDIVYINRLIEDMSTRIDNCGSAISEIHIGIAEIQEAVQKLDGMMKFCYAICQNPGIKDIADANRGRPRAGGFSFAPKVGMQSSQQGAAPGSWRP